MYKTLMYCLTIFSLNNTMLLAQSIQNTQYTQPIPTSFLERMTNNGKAWRAVSYDRVQVSGNSKPTSKGSVTFKEGKVEIIDQNNIKSILSYEIEAGVVDPLLKTSDGKVYEIRFYNTSLAEVMRLRCIQSKDGLHYFEATSYMH